MKKIYFFIQLLIALTLSNVTFAHKINSEFICPTAILSYPGSSFCTSQQIVNATLLGTGDYTGGTFSSTSGIVIDSISGDFFPTLSTPGTYIITYFKPAEIGCYNLTVTTIVTIVPVEFLIPPTQLNFCNGSTYNIVLNSSMNSEISYNTVCSNVIISNLFGSATNLLSIEENAILIDPSIPGTINYSFTTYNGVCYSQPTFSTITINPLPNLITPNDGTIIVDANNGSVISPFTITTGLNSTEYLFQWYLDGNQITNANSNEYIATTVGTYSVNATNIITNCTNTSNVQITSILNYQTNDQVNELISYVNSTNNTLNFKHNFPINSVQIFNQLGQTVMLNEMNSKNGSINLSQLNSGIYNILFTTESEVIFKKIIKP